MRRGRLPVVGPRALDHEDPACFSRLSSRRVGTAPVRFRAQQSVRG
ncbi:hypothetical protein [Streptomyces subrutilus]|nr:hypothetical protein OG479_30725 [Streptomyces subrutilus]